MDFGQNNILSLLLQLGANPQRAQAALKILDASSTGLERNTRVMQQHTSEILVATRAQQQAMTVFTQMHGQSQLAATQTDQHTNALERSTQALRAQSEAGSELAGKGLAGLIAGRKAQAGVEAVWETARGIALLAEGTWPPNPAAIVAAGLHFEAAAQYALLAGRGSSRSSASAAGSGSGGSSRGSAGAGFGPQMPNPELASGAAGASARFSGSGVVIIRGTQDFENYVASAVNGAVARGVSVTATSAQRGSPVGH
jgi:hypothetical protein